MMEGGREPAEEESQTQGGKPRVLREGVRDQEDRKGQIKRGELFGRPVQAERGWGVEPRCSEGVEPCCSEGVAPRWSTTSTLNGGAGRGLFTIPPICPNTSQKYIEVASSPEKGGTNNTFHLIR